MRRSTEVIQGVAICALWQLFWGATGSKGELYYLCLAIPLAIWLCSITIMDILEKKKFAAVARFAAW